MNILITGGAGFIGAHTAQMLAVQGHQVRVYDCLDPQIHGVGADFPEYLRADNIVCVRGDVRDPKAVTQALKGMDAVLHLAALTGVGQSMYELGGYTDVNVGGTAHLLDVLIREQESIRRVVLGSSRAVYGEGTGKCPEHGLFHPEPRSRIDLEKGRFDVLCPRCGQALVPVPTPEERPLKPLSVYAWTKEQQERLFRYASDTFGLPVTILRYFNVYGPRQSLRNPYTGIISIFFSRIRSASPISIYELNKPLRDMVSVHDVARANVLALTGDLDEKKDTFNIGTGHRHTIQEIAQVLMRKTGRSVQIDETLQFRMGDILQCFADLDESRSLLGYVPEVDLDEGLERFVEWADKEECSTDMYQRTVDELKSFNLFGDGRSES